MARGKRKEAAVSAKSDPKVRDVVIANRIRLMVDHEACHQAWGCVLYRLHRLGHLTTEQVDGLNRYQESEASYRYSQAVDPDELPDYMRELWDRRIERDKHRYKTACELLGPAKGHVDAVIFDELWPEGEVAKKEIREGGQRVAHFFRCGRNKT